MPTTAAKAAPTDLLRTLPGDDVRQVMWRFADRYDLQMLVQSTRAALHAGATRSFHSLALSPPLTCSWFIRMRPTMSRFIIATTGSLVGGFFV